jgi:ABC-type antimicrobial peptide transport system ATPase subunit
LFQHIPSGCSLSPRCPEMIPGTCDIVTPQLLSTSKDRCVACHLYRTAKEQPTKGGNA